MVGLTPGAISKVKEILSQQTPLPTGLRIAVVGGGCSGFSYHMAFENQVNENSDNVYEFEGLKVLVDQMSEMYLDGVQVDYIESIDGSGFKFNNPNVKSTCGCGSSFSA
jgi:iron-sulfur cluster assembly accessory protein